MDAVAGYDSEDEVRLVLKYRVRRRDDDISEQDVFGVNGRRSVERGDHRNRNVQQIGQNFLAFTIDLVVAARREEIEALRIDPVDERLTGACQNDYTIV